MRNGKRILSLALLVLLVVLLMPVAAHADPPKGDTHLHSWSVVSETPATCTKPGTKTWRCSACGDTYTEQTSPALGHDFGNGRVTREATCTKEGEKTWTCSRCGATKTDTFPAKGHSPVSIPAVAATCTATGLTEGEKCSICGEILKAQETIAATGHAWSDWATQTEATCTDGGIEIRTCLSCGTEETRSTDALGHAPVTIPGSDPTCEADGYTDGETCDRCGFVLKERQVLPAIGHAWDEGAVTTEPSGFTPGVRTFTCKNDPGHTRTEEIDPSPWLFQDGAVTRHGGDSLTLHVAATGGTGDYTYEWKYRPTYNSTIGNIISWTFLHTSGKQTEPVFEAYDGNMRYWCVVTDSAGNTAQSETAIVSYKLGIAKQPDNANLQPTGKATLSCLAEDGSGSYSYRWIDNQDNEIDVGSSIDVTEIGDYMCIATDDVTGEEAHSYVATVYDTEPFTMVYFTGDAEYVPEGEGSDILMAEFKGGVQPYEIWWDKDGEAHESQEGDMNENYGSVVHITTLGDYTVHAVDAMGEVITATSHLTAPKLTIVEQPVGGTIPKGGYATINVRLADEGQIDLPYLYMLYRNGEHQLQYSAPQISGSFSIWYPGEYYIRIVDNKGRTAGSDVVTFEDEVFRITKQPRSASLKALGETASLEIEVKGGVEPYTYEWMQYKGDTPWYTKASTTATCIARQPGRYACLVTDDTGETLHSKEILVTYSGDTPWITQQPKSGVLEQGGSLKLSCDAVSGSGGELRFDWEVTPTGVRPSWSNVSRSGGSYKNIDATVPGTYRCKVTDTKTGKYVYTKAAFVGESFEFGSIEKTNYSQGITPIQISVNGGIAPYYVKVYVKYPYWTGTATEYKDVLFNHFSVNSLSELAQKTIYLDDLVKYIGIASTGESHYVNEIARYYIEITDSLGNKVHSEFTPRAN